MRIETQQTLLRRFRQHLNNKTTDFASSSLRVPASHYTDPHQTKAEIEALFLNRPLVVALTPDVPNPGDFVCHDVLETPLLVVRDDDGNSETLQFEESWSRDDATPIGIEHEYSIGENVDLLRVRVRSRRCECSEPADDAEDSVDRER